MENKEIRSRRIYENKKHKNGKVKYEKEINSKYFKPFQENKRRKKETFNEDWEVSI